MRFTEGYWLRSQRMQEHYAAQVWETEHLEDGMRLLVPLRKVPTKGDTVNVPCLTVTFRAVAPDTVSVKIVHFEGYNTHKPAFSLHENPQKVKIVESADAIAMETGSLCVRVDKKEFGYSFEKDGAVITRCGFRNLGYMEWDRQPSTMLPGDHYLDETRMKPYIVNELSLEAGECIYGFGERFTSFVKNGQSVQTWNEDGGTASSIAYKCIPFYMTSRGYGVLVNHSGNVEFEAASEKVACTGFSVQDEAMEYLFFYGPSLKKVLSRYTELTGRPALPPAWSFGLWLSTSFTTSYDEKTTSSFIQGMKDREIPLSVFHYDCYWMREFRLCDFDWDQRLFPDPEGMIRRNHEKGVKVCVWMNPYIAQNTALFHEAMENGYLLMRADGKGVWQTDNWEYGMGIVDFTNPDAYRWFQEKLRALCRMGIDCFKTDFGERIPVNVRYHNGADPVAMHNYYTLIYNRCVFEVLEEEKGKGNAVLFARSATVGSQQFPVHWGGDCMATYPSMAETLRGGLSLAMSGFAFWSHDISGFESTATPDLYKRWAAFGLLSSHSRLHGAGSYRVPWAFDEESCEVVKYFTGLKCALMPYLYQLAVNAHNTGIPLMRPMILEFMDDPAVRWLDMQYMLGGSLLTAPVFSEDGTVDYYLPQGIWTDFFTGETKQGGKWYNDRYDYLHLPLYVRENTLLPVGSCRTRPDYAYEQDLEIRWYQPAEEGRAQVEIVNQDGQRAALVHARKDRNRIFVSVEGSLPGLSFRVPGQEQLQIKIEQC